MTSPRPNIERPRPVTYLELEYRRWHPKPIGQDFTPHQDEYIEWDVMKLATWTLAITFSLSCWGLLLLAALYWRS